MGREIRKAKVVLIYPSSFPERRRADIDIESFNSLPNGVLCVASYVEKQGYLVRLIDARLYPKTEALNILKREVEGTLCVGFSVMTCQIKHALQLSYEVKKIDPSLPIVWGGIHPTLYPEQTCQEKVVDYAISGEGENTFLKLLYYLDGKNRDLSSLKGLAYKHNREVKINEFPDPIDVNLLPPLSYHLLDIEKYIERKISIYGKIRRVRALDIHTSRGCPYRCAFCTNTLSCFNTWRPLPLERVLNELEEVINNYKLNHIWFTDDFFFGARERVKKIAEFLIRKKYGITWEANIRPDNFNENLVDDNFLRLLKRSGCWMLRMGIESGSPRILKILKKNITSKQAGNAFKKCREYGIIPIGFFMAGIPGEKEEDFLKTIDLIIELESINPNSHLIPPGIFRPYPGTEMYEECLRLDFRAPESLKEWGNYDFEPGSNLYINPKDLPWSTNPSLFIDASFYLSAYLYMRAHSEKGDIPLLAKMAGLIGEKRLKKRFFRFRLEPWLFYRFQRFLVGLARGKGEISEETEML